jgi:putative CRISPR-associated protein (TIGR02620 family)
MNIELVVTRHAGLVEVLAGKGLCPAGTPVIAHARPSDVKGKHVAGVLPLSLAAECASVTEVTLNLPAEMRGTELTAAQLRQYMTGVSRYVVHKQ